MWRAVLLVAVLSLSGCSRSLEDRITGTWYLRQPPSFQSDSQYQMAIQRGAITFTRNGIVWATYEIVDDATLRLTHAETPRQPRAIEQRVTVRVEDDGSMSWFPAGTNSIAAFIFTREDDPEIFSR